MPQPPPRSSVDAQKPNRPPVSRRKWWFRLHSWVGLKLSILMLFVCATGTLAVLANEIDWMLHPAMRVQPRMNSQRASWGEWVDVVQRQYPTWRIRGVEAPIDPWFAAKVWMLDEAGRPRFVWVDPYSAEVTGVTGWFNAHRLLRNTHRHLMMPIRIGLTIVCMLALALLVTMASSLVVYKRWWRGFMVWPRRDRPRRFWGDLHRLIGVWSLWFVALIAVTGVWYLVEQWGGAAPALASVEAVGATTRRTEWVPETRLDPAAVDRIIAAARDRWPSFEVVSLWPPAEVGGTLTLQGQAEAILVRSRANAMSFDPVRAELRASRRGTDLGVHQRIAEMADPLHFGTWGGLPSKLVWFAAGVLMTVLAATGVWLYGLRVVGEAASMPTMLVAAWRGFGRWRTLWIIVLLVWLLLLPLEVTR